MDDTFNNSSMAGKIVAILIALLFIVVLAFPIANSLSNTGGNGGGNGESEKVMLNTFESTQGYDLSPYNSYQTYVPAMTPTLPHEITYTLEDLNEISSIWDSRFEGTENDISILEAYDVSHSGVRIYYDMEEGDIDVTIFTNNSGTGTYLTDITSLDLTISTDYSLDCSYTYVYPAGSDPRTESIQITVTEYIQQLSESEDGWMWLSQDLLNKISVGSEVMLGGYVDSIGEEWYKTILITEDMISDNHLQFTIDWGEGYTSDVDLELQSTDMAGVWKFTDIYDWYGTVKDNGVEIDSEDTSCWIQYLSTYGYTQSESGTGSGSDSGTSVDGIAGTLIKLVPILMIIGLLMIFIIPMVYKPN